MWSSSSSAAHGRLTFTSSVGSGSSVHASTLRTGCASASWMSACQSFEVTGAPC
jgi:hypothetical protein